MPPHSVTTSPRGLEPATPWITGQNAVPLKVIKKKKERRKDLAQFFIPNSSVLDIPISHRKA